MEAPQLDHGAAEQNTDYSKRSQWLRAALLGANDGLVSTASLMMGVGAVKRDTKAMVLTGVAGLFAGACSMAIGEFVSVQSQLDIKLAEIKRNRERGGEAQEADDNRERGGEAQEADDNIERGDEAQEADDNIERGGEAQEADDNIERGGEAQEADDDEDLPNPVQAAVASAVSFSVGALVPLLAGSFIKEQKIRLGVVVAAVTLALVVFGSVGAVLGKAPVARSAARVLIGGWLAMAITTGLTKLISSSGI